MIEALLYRIHDEFTRKCITQINSKFGAIFEEKNIGTKEKKIFWFHKHFGKEAVNTWQLELNQDRNRIEPNPIYAYIQTKIVPNVFVVNVSCCFIFL